ncbi:MAG: delta-60 repeat domain-containing protein [Ignavibacteriaceae bacterium]|nr:delta-60 repeat domain-containing protein [Ignavibacteriaceae bacterium]
MKNNYFLFLLSVLLGLFSISQTVCQTVYENYWVPNNTVFTTVCSGNTVYIGGAFTHVGPSTGCGTAIDLTTGNPNLTFDKVNGSVAASVPDGSGGWYIGGVFTKVGSVPRNMLAHINADGSLDLD